MAYLENDPEGLSTAQITRLLRDESADNAALILELIAGGGINRRLLSYLFGLAVFHAEAETNNRAFTLLRRHASPDTVRQAEKLRAAAAYYYNEAEYLGKHDNPEIDLFDFLLAYKMCQWHRGGGARGSYFLVSHQTLNLSHYPYDTFSPSLANLDFIRYLAMPTHREFDLEASFPYLLKLPLETIFFENTRLETFPIVLFQLPHLRTLSIKRGAIRPRQPMHVPEGGPHGSATLEKLILDSYPVSGEMRLGPFPQLVEAYLHRCGIHILEFLQASNRLEHLNARGNNLESLPAFLSNFTALRTIDLGFNPLRKIELDLERLAALEELEIKVSRGRR